MGYDTRVKWRVPKSRHRTALNTQYNSHLRRRDRFCHAVSFVHRTEPSRVRITEPEIRMAIRAKEWELLSFFETEPRLLDSDVVWDYNDALYEIKRESLGLSFAIAPAYQDVRIVLKAEGARIYELNAMAVNDVMYSSHDGIEQLRIVLSDDEQLTLKVKPSIELLHAVNRRPV